MSDPARPVAVLVGPPGAGKTTIGRKLARRLDVPFRDADHLIEEAEGRSIPEIFAADGEPHFREIEERIIGDALASFDGVLSLGGGAVLSAVTRQRLRGHRVVHLTIGVAEGVRRSQGAGRPLLSGGDVTARYQALLTERSPLYREVAWTTVSTERRSSGKVVTDIVDRLESGDPHLRGGGRK
ncbi:shikimate kinase [Dietzia kunjamensis subsp. schimae]|uniref:Shikimate kinase n=1 Tax=Dietzia kunjamensis subsp. schimae TaxID=498198 RepID=A0ABY1MYG7_9ACTN|nr:shikimate kinase [Dietzia kunjamensis]MBB1014517.1 shikimate kinase [Dietzia kunjamensis subsp. schimae]SMO33704.1 shikimate kinase [Dietzia kunjamensis subsp. schimae]